MSSDTVKEATSSKKNKNTLNKNGFDQIGGSSTSASTPSLTSTSTSTSYYITGFGPFGGVDDNPSSTIIDSLKELQKNHNNHNHNGDNEKQDGSISDIDIDSGGGGGNDLHLLLSKIQYLKVVKVAAYSAKQEVETIISLIRQRKCDRDRDHDHDHDRTPHTHTRDHAIILHLGVNHNLSMKTIPTIQLEQNAFNQAHFRIPDEDGYQPVKELIVNHSNVNIDVDVEKVDVKANENENERVDDEQKRGTSRKGGSSTKRDRDRDRDRLTTDLNAKRIKGYLTDKHKLHADTGDKNPYEVALSGDAGRFVCNYIYYQSLYQIHQFHQEQEAQQQQQQQQRQGVQVHSLFVHVPTFDAIPKDAQVEFVLHLIEAAEDAVVAQDKKRMKLLQKQRKKKKEQQQRQQQQGEE